MKASSFDGIVNSELAKMSAANIDEEIKSPTALPDKPRTHVDLTIGGMTCAACAQLIERRLKKSIGVIDASVNFATSRASVDFDADVSNVPSLIHAVEDAGYGARLPQANSDAELSEVQTSRDAEYEEARRKFLVAAVLSLPVLIIAMSHGRVGWLNFEGSNWVQLVLTTPVVLYSGLGFYRGAWAAFRHRAADMNTLIALGTGAAYLYSVAATIVPGFFIVNKHASMQGMAAGESVPV